MHDVERCFSPVDGDCPDLADAAELYFCTDQYEWVTAWLAGPIAEDGACCYQVDVDPPGGMCIPGRPFVVEGIARRAPVRRGVHGWQLPAGREVALDLATRVRIGEAWAEDAALEHASVASFGKLALELLAFGAPAALVREAHAAAIDEVRHAELCFALASRYLGVAVGPGPLAAAGTVVGAGSLAELAAAAVREGCVGEALAAAVAGAQAEAAEDAEVRATLVAIAEDEAGHAALAYRIVAWALAVGGAAVRASVQAAFVAALGEREVEVEADAEVDPRLRAHGRLGRGEVRAEQRRTLAEVVVPARTALLGLPA